MTNPPRRVRAGLALVASLALAVPMMSGGSAAAVDAGDCTDVLFLGARGSGQPQSGSGDDGGTGLGREVYDVSQRLARQLPGRSITVSAVQYPAQGVELLVTSPDTYFGGLEGGVVDVQGQLRERAAICPTERIVLSGYSQGAMVVHRALQDLDRAGDPTARQILARTDGVVLISDGDRRPRDRMTSYGSAGPSRGIGFDLRPDSGARGTKLPAGMKARIHSVCLDFDVVCDYQRGAHTGLGALRGAAIHSDGYTNSRPVDRATDAVAARLR
jgi:hypothetical protein